MSRRSIRLLIATLIFGIAVLFGIFSIASNKSNKSFNLNSEKLVSKSFFLDTQNQPFTKESYLEKKNELVQIKNENLKLKDQVNKIYEQPEINLDVTVPSDQLKPCAKVL